MLRGAVLLIVLAVLSLVMPIVERSQVEGKAFERTRQLLNGAAWQWQGLVAAGTSPGEATETVSDALHARVVSSNAERIDIPFTPESNVDALHNSFRLNPFIRGTIPKTSDPVEERELRESATRVAVLSTAIRRSELDRAVANANRHLLWGLLCSLAAGSAAAWLIVGWRRRAYPAS